MLLTNPPFAGEVRDQGILSRYELARKGRGASARPEAKVERDVLFIERCLQLLKPGGRMAIILPQGMFRVTLKLEFATTETKVYQEDLAAGVVPVVQKLFASITNWVVVQKTAEGEVHWLIETKGRVWEGTEAKDAAIRDWCQRITEQTGRRWEFARVNQATFQASNPKTLAEAVRPL